MESIVLSILSRSEYDEIRRLLQLLTPKRSSNVAAAASVRLAASGDFENSERILARVSPERLRQQAGIRIEYVKILWNGGRFDNEHGLATKEVEVRAVEVAVSAAKLGDIAVLERALAQLDGPKKALFGAAAVKVLAECGFVVEAKHVYGLIDGVAVEHPNFILLIACAEASWSIGDKRRAAGYVDELLEMTDDDGFRNEYIYPSIAHVIIGMDERWDISGKGWEMAFAEVLVRVRGVDDFEQWYDSIQEEQAKVKALVGASVGLSIMVQSSEP
ncbi:MAG: hypothetical protein WD294_09645 [Phycisphaeraceae bacterium]